MFLGMTPPPSRSNPIHTWNILLCFTVMLQKCQIWNVILARKWNIYWLKYAGNYLRLLEWSPLLEKFRVWSVTVDCGCCCYRHSRAYTVPRILFTCLVYHWQFYFYFFQGTSCPSDFAQVGGLDRQTDLQTLWLYLWCQHRWDVDMYYCSTDYVGCSYILS